MGKVMIPFIMRNALSSKVIVRDVLFFIRPSPIYDLQNKKCLHRRLKFIYGPPICW